MACRLTQSSAPETRTQPARAASAVSPSDGSRAVPGPPRPVVRSAAEAIVSVDDGWEIALWSPEAETMFGHAENDAIGRPFETLFAERSCMVERRAILESLSADGPGGRSQDLVAVTKGGAEFPVEITVSAPPDGRGLIARLREVPGHKAEGCRVAHDLQGRVKELNCLHGISKLVHGSGMTLDALFSAAVALIPPSWQCPDIACARISHGDREFVSEGFEETAWRLAADIAANELPVGRVEVYYREERPRADEGPFLAQERKLIDAVANELGHVIQDVQSERTLRMLAGDLGRRAREMDCLYGIFSVVEMPGAPLDDILGGVADMIPHSWQRPDNICARIVHGGKEHRTAAFEETPWLERAELTVDGEPVGAIEVYYKSERSEADEGSSLKDERSLLNLIAEEVSRVVESKTIEEELRKHRDHLEELVKERTAVLTKVNRRLETEIEGRRQTEQSIQRIAEGVSSLTGDAFFSSLVQWLGRTIGASHVFIGELTSPSMDHVETKAACIRGELVDSFEYHLAGTPCENLLKLGNGRPGIGSYTAGTHPYFPGDPSIGKHGTYSYVGTPLADSTGNVRGVMVALDDKMTRDPKLIESVFRIFATRAAGEFDRKRAEEVRNRLATAVEQSGESIVITDSDGAPTYVNQAFERTTGYSRDEVLGKSMSMLQSGEHDAEFYSDLWQTVAGGATWTGQFTNKRKDGTAYQESATISPVRDSTDNTTKYIKVSRDITERIRLEQELRQSQKMEAIGRLAGGIAHDFNNLLTVMGGFAQLLGDRVSGDDKALQYVTEIGSAVDRAADMTGQLLTFSRKAPRKPRQLDLNAVVTDAERMLRRMMGGDVRLRTDLAADVRPIKADHGQMGQILLNFASNAREAMPIGGTLTIATANVEIDEATACQKPELEPGSFVMLSVSDDGVGMDESIRKRVFEPFFTTKGENGTGMGLSTVYGIVKQHEGGICCYSEPGRGTTFNIYIPPLEGSGEDIDEAGDERDPARGGETILVVEDDPAILDVATEIIEGHGYTVLRAKNGVEALQIAGDLSNPLDLLVADVVLPDLGGVELAGRLAATRPDLRVLYASGHPAEVAQVCGIEERKVEVLQKPYGRRGLLSAIRAVLDRR